MIRIIHGNALDLPLEDNTVDLVVTSPPYFGLRSYQDGGEHYEGQIGSEATPAEFVDALIAATREMVRVLKPSGSIWVNLGDKYSGVNIGTTSGHKSGTITASSQDRMRTTAGMDVGGRPKSLIGIPWRYAIRCIDDLGLILRAEVIWSKPNGLPESVTDRVRRSHEQWFHFTVQPRYYSAVDEVREEHASAHPGRGGLNKRGDESYHALGGAGATGKWDGAVSALGKLPGSVWNIPTQPLRVPAHLGIDHFAAFPMEWPRRIITGWSPREVCSACGEGRRPVVDRHPIPKELKEALAAKSSAKRHGDRNDGQVQYAISGPQLSRPWRAAHPETITGYACDCPDTSAPTTPGVVLDPFGGTGTTALVADVLGRDAIHVDLSADYCRLAEWRTTDPGERARAMQVQKPETVIEGQMDLLEGLTA